MCLHGVGALPDPNGMVVLHGVRVLRVGFWCGTIDFFHLRLERFSNLRYAAPVVGRSICDGSVLGTTLPLPSSLHCSLNAEYRLGTER